MNEWGKKSTSNMLKDPQSAMQGKGEQIKFPYKCGNHQPTFMITISAETQGLAEQMTLIEFLLWLLVFAIERLWPQRKQNKKTNKMCA